MTNPTANQPLTASPSDLLQVTIGPITYQVQYVPNLHDENHQSIDGAVYEGKALIEINAALDPQGRRVTLWHEILEIVCMQAGTRLSEEDLDALAYGIMGVLKQNPRIRQRP